MDKFLTEFLSSYGIAASALVLGSVILLVWAVAHRQASPGDNVSVFFGLAAYTKGQVADDDASGAADDCDPEDVVLDRLGLRFLSKLEASALVHEKFADPSIKHIAILSYTNEVEAGSITKYRVRGKKTFEVLKRSPLEDLTEEQSCNIARLRKGARVRPWRKFRKSVEASRALQGQAGEALLRIDQLCYPGPPQRRAYVFDGVEALVSFYEHAGDPERSEGSLFKGMGDSLSLHVNRTSRLGRFILDDVTNSLATLRKCGRSWRDEASAIAAVHAGQFVRSGPTLRVDGVMLDMDGVLYDSMPHYVRAWRAGLREFDIEVDERDVYLHEGRSGPETVGMLFAQHARERPSAEMVERVLEVRDAALERLGLPPVQSGARRLVSEIDALGLPMVVVTGSSHRDLATRLSRDFNRSFDAADVVDGHGVAVGKPTPVPYFLGAQRLGVMPGATVTVENSPLGTLSAAAAGSFAVAVNTGVLDDDVLCRAGARAVFSSCGELARCLGEIVDELRDGASVGDE